MRGGRPAGRRTPPGTRARIVEAAAHEFRAHGVSGAGVAGIMRRAGLTHGGFYAHFSSKHELLEEALERAVQQTRATLAGVDGSLEALPGERRLAAVADRYLSPMHAAHPERGCPIAALAPELVRAGRGARRTLARLIRSRLEWMRGSASAPATDQPTEEQAVGALACMVGGIVLARGLAGAEGEGLLEACRTFLHHALGRAGGPEDQARREEKGLEAPRANRRPSHRRRLTSGR